MSGDERARERLEYLRSQLRAERISYGELAELASLRDHIEPGDVELLEAAGVPEHEPRGYYEFRAFIAVRADDASKARELADGFIADFEPPEDSAIRFGIEGDGEPVWHDDESGEEWPA